MSAGTASNARRRRHAYGNSSVPRAKRHSPYRKDPVTPELFEAVILRDRGCIGERVIPGHSCRTRLTPDHVHWHAGGSKGKRAPSRLEHLVTMCLELNTSAPSREVREAERLYLRKLYPGHGTATGCLCDELVPHG